MPRITSESAIIELSIHSIDESDETCYICAHRFCTEAQCCRTLTHLKCCTQPICCACTVKIAKRCTCADECAAVIAYCPYCRMISPVLAIDIFLGACVKQCKMCDKADEAPCA